MSDSTQWIVVPIEPPDSIPVGFDEVLFTMCRDDDYRGLYREFMRLIQSQAGSGLETPVAGASDPFSALVTRQ